MSAADYGRTLSGLSVNLIVRDVGRSVPFYTGVLEDPDGYTFAVGVPL